ncbi:AEC family transporter [uncultured Enterovirga sp.]|uniref:AEC family transporter n=1 Tax=uncultured Enterovirga sp. TaxID=2026352 RepID=UPI0035CA9712
MTAWIDAFLPTFGLIALGSILRARVLTDAAVWRGLETLTFWVLLPALLAHSISRVELSTLPLASLGTVLWLTLLLATASAIGISRLFGHDRAAMTSIVQGGIRFNTYTALGISAGLYGEEGLALGGVVGGLVVTGAQTILAVVFVVSDGRRVSPLRILVQVVSNPLLLGCLVGFAFAAAGGMPPGIGPLARSLGQASLALGLLCVGAGLSLASLREAPATQVAITVQKLVAVPAVTLALAWAFGLEGQAASVAVLVMAMPTATTAYVMARALGGDARLMAATITLQHLAALVTLPAWAALLR